MNIFYIHLANNLRKLSKYHSTYSKIYDKRKLNKNKQKTYRHFGEMEKMGKKMTKRDKFRTLLLFLK